MSEQTGTSTYLLFYVCWIWQQCMVSRCITSTSHAFEAGSNERSSSVALFYLHSNFSRSVVIERKELQPLYVHVTRRRPIQLCTQCLTSSYVLNLLAGRERVSPARSFLRAGPSFAGPAYEFIGSMMLAAATLEPHSERKFHTDSEMQSNSAAIILLFVARR